MNRLTDNKIVLVTRPTRLAELVIRFNTVSQARFYVEHQGADFSDYLREDETYHRALAEAQTALAQVGRVQLVDRGFLPNFVFAPDDTLVTLGQDGLVANTLKYLNGQPVVGVNPDPERWDGRLLPFRVGDLSKVMPEVVLRKRHTKSVTMAKATLNNGQTLYGVNDLFIGPKTHSSARYLIRNGEVSETQSSSGVIVSTGMGSTGWLKSLLAGAAAITQSAGSVLAQRATEDLFVPKNPKVKGSAKVRLNVKTEFAWDANYLFYTVREPFPTKTTGASLVFGRVTPETPLILESRMAENGVIFSDGIEKDFLEFNSGTQAVIGIAERKGVLGRPTLDQVKAHFNWPVFIKGARQTNRHQRKLSLIESDSNFLEAMERYAADPILGWQDVVCRKFVPLRAVANADADSTKVPRRFEFRTFWWRGQLAGAGRYWKARPMIGLRANARAV